MEKQAFPQTIVLIWAFSFPGMYVILSDFFGSDYNISIKCCFVINYTVFFSGMVVYNMHVRIGTAS